MAVILLVVGPMSVLRAFFMAGYIASVPALVGRPQIGRANGYFEAVYSVSFIIGPAVAGILATTIGPGPTLAIDAVSFAISAAGLLLVRRDLRAPIDRVHGRFVTEIRDGIDYIVQHPILRAVILFWSAVSVLLAPLVTALAVMVTRDLGEPPAVLGLILTGYGAGTVVGSLLTTRRSSRRRIAPMLLGGNVLMGLCLVLLATVATVPALVARGRRCRGGPDAGGAHLHHGAGGVFAGRAAGSDRQHRADGLARPPAGRACWSAARSSTSRRARPSSAPWGSRSAS